MLHFRLKNKTLLFHLLKYKIIPSLRIQIISLINLHGGKFSHYNMLTMLRVLRGHSRARLINALSQELTIENI